MPIKQVTCCQCNKLVNKAITYSIGNGQRACRDHPGVTEKKDEQLALTKKKNEMQVQKLEHRYDTSWRDNPVSFTPKCWVCMNEGLRQDEFFTRWFIEREKAEVLHGPWNPFDPKHPANSMKLGRCIFVLAKDKCDSVTKYIREDFLQLVQMTGLVAICGPCVGTLKVDLWKDQPQPTLEQAFNIGAAFEAFVRPVIQEVAKQEMARDN